MLENGLTIDSFLAEKRKRTIPFYPFVARDCSFSERLEGVAYRLNRVGGTRMDNVIKKELAERDEATRPHLEKLKPHRAFAQTNPTGIPGKREKSRSLMVSATDGFRLVDSKLNLIDMNEHPSSIKKTK